MYARTLTGRLRADAHSDVINYFRLTIGPALRQQTGFLNGRLLTDKTTHRCLVLTVWETEADRQRADANQSLQTLLGHLQQYCIEFLVGADYELTAQLSWQGI